MVVKIHQFTNSFSHVASIVTSLSNTTSMSISHFAACTKATESTLTFYFEGVESHIPYIEDEEFCIVIRKKVDMTATGSNGGIITNIGEDIGEYDYKNSVPKRLLGLPPGFTELYKG